MNEFIADIENICLGFASTFQDQLTWEWDDRFEAVLAVCKTEVKVAVSLSWKYQMKAIWDNSNTEDASDTVLDAISHFGGLMPGQLLFTSDPAQNILLCCAWWPWGDGKTASIRIAPYQNKISDPDKAMVRKKLQNWFGISKNGC